MMLVTARDPEELVVTIELTHAEAQRLANFMGASSQMQYSDVGVLYGALTDLGYWWRETGSR